MKIQAVAWLLALGLLTDCTGLQAHHGSYGYRADKIVVLKGAVVTKFMWVNPHSFVLFDAKDEQGNVEHWAGEAGSPAALRQAGWNKSSVHPGDVVTVFMYESKFERNVALLSKIVLADGRTFTDSPRADGGSINRF